MKNLSFWLDLPYQPRPPLSGLHETQVAILGGGLTGIQAAYWLKQLGARTAVVEAEVVGAGASGRNAGFLLAGLHYHYSTAKRLLGAERTRTLWTLSLENHWLLAKIVADEKIDCDYARNGSFSAAASPQEMEEIRASVRELNRDGFNSSIVERFLSFHGACFHPYNGELHPVKYLRGLAAKLDTVFEHTPVTGLTAEGSGVRVLTRRGEIRADIALLCLNAYVGKVYPSFQEIVHPVRGQALATEPVRERILQAPVYANYGFEYFRQLRSGELILGGGRRLEGEFSTTFDDAPTDSVQRFLDQFLASRLRPARVTHRWGGLMGFSCDELPCAGPIPGTGNLFACVGYTGHGLGFSTVLSKMVSEMIVRGKTAYPWQLFDIRRHT